MKLNLKQIAKELDVSISTVSKALHNNPEISIETRQKIKAFAKFYNYKPNNTALSLKNQKTHTIGIVVPEIVHHFFAKVISGAEQIANKKGYHVMICLSNNSFDKEVVNMEILANGSIDGFILSVSKETQQKKDYHHLTEVIDQGMPIVLFDRIVDEVNCDKVIIDDEEGARKAVRHLLKIGCQRIALITTVDYVTVGELRTRGYYKALEDYQMSVDEMLVLKIEDMDGSEAQIMEFLKDAEVDGVFAVNEQFATSAVKGIYEKKLKVPEDVSVIAFTNGEISKRFIPNLTTISQHGAEIGARAMEILIERIEEAKGTKNPFRTEIIKTSLIERDSTKALFVTQI